MLDQSSKDATQESNKHSLINFTFYQKYRKGSHNETDVWDIWKTDSRTIRWDLWSEYNWLGWFFMETFIFDCTQRFTYFQILCYALERWTSTHNQILSGKTSWRGSKVRHNTELWTQLMVSRWNSSGIFSQDSLHLQLCNKVQEFLSKMSVEPKDFTGRIIFMSMFNDISWGSKGQWTGMRIKRPNRFDLCEKIFTRKMVIPRTWIRKEVVFYSW